MEELSKARRIGAVEGATNCRLAASIWKRGRMCLSLPVLRESVFLGFRTGYCYAVSSALCCRIRDRERHTRPRSSTDRFVDLIETKEGRRAGSDNAVQCEFTSPLR